MVNTKRLSALIISMIGICLNVTAQTEPYLNRSLSADERAADLLSRMTLEEKISQLNNNSPAVPRLGIPSYNWWNESLHGVGRAGIATVFPQAIGMAASFDPDALFRSFDMISIEQRAKYNECVRTKISNYYRGLTVWTPNINIFRDPRWGRGQETYGEDPYLTTVMGLAVVRGLQGENTNGYDRLHACAKHFAIHSGPEWNRHSFNAADIDPRDLWETYLPAFKALVTEGNVKEVMCAYNRYEGEPCCSNKKLLKKILREDWKFDDIVVSDCGAISDFFKPYPSGHGTHASYIEAAVDAVLTGNDLECVGMSFWKLKESVEAGLIKESDIDKSVFRLLRARFQLGNLFDNEYTPWWNIGTDTVCNPIHRHQALEMARKSLVLMSNKNNTLPLSSGICKIAVVGPNAADSVMMWGNYSGTPASTTTILQGICAEFTDAEVKYVKGCDHVDDMVMFSDFNLFSHNGKPGLKGTYYGNRDLAGEPLNVVTYTDPLNFTTKGATVFAPNVPLTDFSARYEGVFTPEKDGPVTFYIKADDGYRLKIDGKEVKTDWRNGGKPEVSYILDAERGKSYDVVFEYFQDKGTGALKFDLGIKKTVDYADVAGSVADADAIIFVGGLSPSLEGEEMGVKYDGFKNGDRTKIELPAVQENLLKALKGTGKPLVFVICGGSSLAIPWEARECDAILNAFYPGEAGGTAVAEALSGKYNPGGRLPMTYYNSTDELPDFENYDMYGRTYRYYEGTPTFHFGHGLSYTTFSYGHAVASAYKVKKGNSVDIVIPVSNSGDRDGDEVVQIYIRNLQDKTGPIKSLRAFRRLTVRKGQTENVAFTLPPSAFEFFNPKNEKMEIRKGRYEVLYGGTSEDKCLQAMTLEIK